MPVLRSAPVAAESTPDSKSLRRILPGVVSDARLPLRWYQVPRTELVPWLFDRSELGTDAPEAGGACRRVASLRLVSFRSVIATMGC